MKYYVVWPDGQRFGPADAPTLQQWALENRIDANTTLEDERTGAQMKAGMVLGLPSTPTAYGAPLQGPPTYSGYYRPAQTAPIGGRYLGQAEVNGAWICGSIGLVTIVCCPFPILPIVGAILAFSAKNKNHPHAMPALWFNVAILAIELLFTFFFSAVTLFQ